MDDELPVERPLCEACEAPTDDGDEFCSPECVENDNE